MPTARVVGTVADHFTRSAPNVAATYASLLKAARALGPVREEPKQASIHLVRESAFAGIATQRAALILTLKSTKDIRSRRIRKHEQASANRWHLEIRLGGPAEVDGELRTWLAAAYQMAG
jgi:Domain of unknown function (DUF5655)